MDVVPLGRETVVQQPAADVRGADAEFGSSTENRVLRERIAAEIRASGPMTFCRFMELALYEPSEGYYRTQTAIGRRGDYLTSPELHPLFGATVRRQLTEFWRLLGEPEPFRIVEYGAGTGMLARAILAASLRSNAGEPRAVSYTIVEPAPLARQTQATTLGGLADRVEWVASPTAGETVADCVVSNELVDSFPVHRVAVQQGRLREVFVGLDRGRFVDVLADPSTDALSRYFDRLGLLPAEGGAAEVNLGIFGWLDEVRSILPVGLVLTFDYGYSAPLLYAPWRRQGTLHCFSRHTVGTDPYVRVGLQDITAHVDFTSLAAAGRTRGLEPIGFTSQQHFLTRLGVAEALAGGPAAAASLEEYLARRRAVEALLNPEGLGRVRVLAQARGTGRPSLRGFGDDALQELES